MTQILPQAEAHARAPARLYRMIWRWHFYAGLFCIPFIIILSLTGATYLFKPQIEAAFDAPFNSLTFAGPAKPIVAQVDAALAAHPGTSLKSYRLPQNANDSGQVIVTKDGMDTLAYVHPQTLHVLKSIAVQDRLMAIVATIHGELLMGERGSLLVELAASWALVMMVTGLYLWWPRQRKGLGGVLWPRLGQGRRVFWRDIHSVTGIWISTCAIFLLVSGLPWTSVWGETFTRLREATGLVTTLKDWSLSRASDLAQAQHEGHGHEDHDHENHRHKGQQLPVVTIDDITAKARAGNLHPPVVIMAPNGKNENWRAVSQTQNRPLAATLEFDPLEGALVARKTFADKHPIDQAVGIGIAAHEGHLFGPLNQMLGLLTALGLVTLSVSAFVMWRKRAPSGILGAPPPIADQRIGAGIGMLILGFGVFLPLLGLSLIGVALIERLLIVHFSGLRKWLGLTGPAR